LGGGGFCAGFAGAGGGPSAWPTPTLAAATPKSKAAPVAARRKFRRAVTGPLVAVS